MPLLQGKFDPHRFNSAQLGKRIYEAGMANLEEDGLDPSDRAPDWEHADEGMRAECIDFAQGILDVLAADGIIS